MWTLQYSVHVKLWLVPNFLFPSVSLSPKVSLKYTLTSWISNLTVIHTGCPQSIKLIIAIIRYVTVSSRWWSDWPSKVCRCVVGGLNLCGQLASSLPRFPHTSPSFWSFLKWIQAQSIMAEITPTHNGCRMQMSIIMIVVVICPWYGNCLELKYALIV